jgi:hypothetical protein
VRFEERLLEYLDGFQTPEKVLRLGRRFHPVLVSEPPAAVRLDAAADAWIPPDMRGLELIRVAEELARGNASEPRARSAINRAYYARTRSLRSSWQATVTGTPPTMHRIDERGTTSGACRAGSP